MRSPTRQQLASEKDLPATLASLAKACPAEQAETATRLELQALAAASRAKAKPPVDRRATDRLIAVLADEKARARELRSPRQLRRAASRATSRRLRRRHGRS
jgi:hypothetical protein